MSMTLNLSTPVAARLSERARLENRTPEEMVAALLEDTDALLPGAIEEGSPEEAEAIRVGFADIDTGRYRSLAQYVDDLKARHGVEL